MSREAEIRFLMGVSIVLRHHPSPSPRIYLALCNVQGGLEGVLVREVPRDRGDYTPFPIEHPEGPFDDQERRRGGVEEGVGTGGGGRRGSRHRTGTAKTRGR